MSKNDEKILALKKQVEEKKNIIASKKKTFVPHTNLVIDWRDTKKNINVLQLNDLMFLAWELSSYSEFCVSKNITTNISGYPIECWLTDIEQKIDIIRLKAEEDELKKMESKLDKLLSEDKRTELELDEIAKILG